MMLKLWFLSLLLGLGCQACKHRRGPAQPDELGDLDAQPAILQLKDLLAGAQSLQVREVFEDGFVINDSSNYRLDIKTSKLTVERNFDPVLAAYGFDPLAIQTQSPFPETEKNALLEALNGAVLRHIPRCNPFAAVDGGYGGRFLMVLDRQGKIHSFGANDGDCAESDHDCEGYCLSQAVMSQVFQVFSQKLPLPVKPVTNFQCASDSPLSCGSESRKDVQVYGEWQDKDLRADVRLFLANRLCAIEAFSMQQNTSGDWIVLNRSKEQVGIVRINSQTRLIACIERSKS